MQKILLCCFLLLATRSITPQWAVQLSDNYQYYNSIYFQDKTTGWVGGYIYEEDKFILKTVDGGENWNRVNILGTPSSIHFVNENVGFCVAAFAYKTGNTWLHYIYKTTNGGESWEKIYNDILHTNSVKFFDENSGMALLTDLEGNIWISKTINGGTTWAKSPISIKVTDPKLEFINGSIFMIGRFSNKVWRSNDDGNTWVVVYEDPEGQITDISFSDNMNGYACGTDLYYTRDGGTTWNKKDFNGYYIFEIKAKGNKCWAIINSYRGSYILYSYDLGESWSPVPFNEDTQIHSFFPADEQTAWFCSNPTSLKAPLYYGSVVKTSADFTITAPSTPQLLFPLNNSVLSYNYVEWQNEDYAFYRLQISSDPDFATLLVNDFYLSKNVSFNLESDKIYYWRVRSENAAGISDWSEVWQFNLIITDAEDNSAPLTFELSQNYPNPFNPVTHISFQIPNGGNVELKIFDLLGNELITVANGYFEKGKHEVQFDAAELSSGFYLYQLKSNQYHSTKKMLLLK